MGPPPEAVRGCEGCLSPEEAPRGRREARGASEMTEASSETFASFRDLRLCLGWGDALSAASFESLAKET